MAVIKSSSSQSGPEKDNFRDFLGKDNVENIKTKFSSELQGLQNEIKNENLKWIASSPAELLAKLDNAAEQRFDWWALANEGRINQQIKNNNVAAIRDKFNEEVIVDFQQYIDEIKWREIQQLIDYDYFQLESLSFDVLKSSITTWGTSWHINAPAGGVGTFNTKWWSQTNTNNNSWYDYTNNGNHTESTNVIFNDYTKPNSPVGITTTSNGTALDETWHNEEELTHNGVGDELYTWFTYIGAKDDPSNSLFLSKKQNNRNKKTGDEYDPTVDQKYKYKNKNIEYRDKNKQVYDAILTIMDDFTKADKRGNIEELDLKDIRWLDRTKIPDILYLITRGDKMKEHNLTYNSKENTWDVLGAWKLFANDSNNGVNIPADKIQEFKQLLKGIDYKWSNIKKLITFLNFFGGSDTLPYANKIIDIGSRKGKSGRMQLIETWNVDKLLSATNAWKHLITASDVSNESIFTGKEWTDEVARVRWTHANETAINTEIDPIEKTGNFFSFICDFNNDGRVDQYDLGSSMTWFAFHGMLTSVCDVKKIGKKFEILNGPKTAVVLRNMLEKAYSTSHNVNLRTDIKKLLDSNDFLHTYHVFEIMKKYPEIKPFLIYDIQAESEYAQKTRQIKNTYEAFNPDAANSLLWTVDTDPIDDYFINEAIKEAMGNLHDTNIEKLKAIAAKEWITLNRKVDVDVLRAMNVLVSTLFMNFGPLMRAMQYDRLHAGQNDPGYTGQYNPGNAHLAMEGKIPLSKEEMQRPWNGQETKEFIESTEFKKHLPQIISFNPLLWISTYSDSEGKTQPSPVLWIGVSFDKSKLDPSGKRASHFTQIGLSYDVMDMQLFAGLNGSNVRQINNQNLKDNMDATKPYVRWLGLQYGVWGALDIKNPMQSWLFASVWPLYQVDHLAGLDQVSRNFEMFLSPFTKPIDAKFLTANLSTEADWDKLYIDLENHYLNNFSSKYKEPKYLHLTESMIHLFVGHLQEQRLLENLWQHDLPIVDKQKIVQAYMWQRIDGFTSTLYQAELAKLNTKWLKLSKLWAKVWANLTVESLLNGWPIGVLFSANLSFSAYDEIYGDDPHDINSVSKQLDYGAGMQSLDIPAGSNLEDIAYRLENAFAIDGLSIQADEGKLIFSNKNSWWSVLDLLHLYYTQKAFDDAWFIFDGKKLIVWNVGEMGIANVFKWMTKSHYLILGDTEMIWCIEHNKYKETPAAKKWDKPNITWEAIRPKNADGETIDADDIVEIKQETVNLLPQISDIKKQVEWLKSDEAKKDILPYLKWVDSAGKLLLTIPTTPKTTLINISKKGSEYFVPPTGTLLFIKDMKWWLTLRYSDTPSDKLIIEHKKQINNVPTTSRISSVDVLDLSLDISASFDTAKTTIEANKDKIKKFDNENLKKFFEFLSAAKNVSDGKVDQWDYAQALQIIKDLLTTHVNDTDFTKLLNNAKGDEVVYIVNRLKAIFAENSVFTSAKNVHATLGARGETYKKILGPSGLPIPSEITAIRDQFRTHNWSTDIQEYKNLLWYTAWYRKWGKATDARWYSATAYGHTNVLEGFIQPINNPETKKWMIENLKKDTTYLNIILKSINTSLAKNPAGKGITLTLDNLFEILETWSVSIDKTKKININTNRYFYLLGECANESVWLSLDGDIRIDTMTPDDNTMYWPSVSTAIAPTQKTWSVLAVSKTTKTIDLDVRGKKWDINFVGQGSVQVWWWKENGGQWNEEENGGQGVVEETESDWGGQGTTEWDWWW